MMLLPPLVAFLGCLGFIVQTYCRTIIERQSPYGSCPVGNQEFAWLYHPSGNDPCYVFNRITYPCGGPFLPKPTSGRYDPFLPGSVTSCSCVYEGYGLMAACAYCQGLSYPTYNSWTSVCQSVASLPNNQDLPPWTSLPVDKNGYWDITSARNVTIKSGASSVAEAPTKIPTQTSSGGPSDTNSADQDSTTWKVVVGVVVPVVCALIAAWATIWNRNRNK